MTISIYDPRTLVAALDQCRSPHQFLVNTFFSSVKTFNTQKVDMDIRQGSRQIAAYVNPLENGRVVERAGYETITVYPCYTKEIMVIRPDDTVTRAFGEDYSKPLSAVQREQRLLGEGLVNLDERVVMLEEVMSAQALINGSIYVKGQKNDFQLDIGYTPGRQKITLSGSSCWDKSGDPMYDLDDWSTTIGQRCGMAPDIIICGNRAARAILDNEKVQKRLDLRNFHVGEINISENRELARQGVQYQGVLAPSNIPIYTYNETYVDPLTGKLVPLIPDDSVLMGCTSAGCQMLYGMIQNLNSLAPMPRFPHSWMAQDGSARYIQLESAPLPNLYQVDAFISARVLSK